MTYPTPSAPGPRRPIMFALLAGVAAACVATCLPDQYRSEARILSDAGQGPNTGRPGIWAPSAPAMGPWSREDGPTVVYADILASRRVADRLLAAEYDYRCRTWRFGALHQVHGTLLAYLGAANTDRAIGQFRRLLTVERNPRSGLLRLAAETRSPELSQQVVQQGIEELRGALVAFGQAEGRSRIRSTEARLAEVRLLYADKAASFQQFQDANRNWESSPSPTLRFQGSQMREQLNLWWQVLTNLTLNLEQALLESRSEAQTLLVLDPGGRPGEKSRPHRSFIVLGAMVVTGAASWAVLNPSKVQDLFIRKGNP